MTYTNFTLILIFIVLLPSCVPNKLTTEGPEKFTVSKGFAQFDTSLVNLKTHEIDSGDKYVFVYERKGVTFIDANDYEAQYTESIIFQFDTVLNEINLCDSALLKIDCKYYWICLAKDIRKEIRNIDKGCITFKNKNDSMEIQFDLDPKFKFGGYQEKDKTRIIKYETTWR